MKALVSIIVPVYNVQIYLSQCIESLIAQTYKNIEIILVDDGSTDNSGCICDAFALKDPRIKVYHKKNEGNTSARKYGLKYATGRYVGFIDSDDWIDSDMYEKLVDKIDSEVEMVVSGQYIEKAGVTSLIIDPIPPGKYATREKLTKIYENLFYFENTINNTISVSLCNKLFLRELITSILLPLDNDIQYGEDTVCTILALLNAKGVYVLNNAFYHYRKRDGSIVNSKDQRFLEKVNRLYLYLYKKISLYPQSQLLLQQLDLYVVELILRGINNMMGLHPSVNVPYFIFPRKYIHSGDKVILYGAGVVGQAYYKQLTVDAQCSIIDWIDRNYKLYRKRGLKVNSINNIFVKKFDYIILAVKFEGLAKQIKEELILKGVLEEKIIWYQPQSILEYYFMDLEN